MRPLPLLLCLLLSAPVFAGVNLADAPVRRSLLTATNSTDSLKTELGFKDTLKLYGAGVTTAVIAVPASLLLGMALGGISNNLYVAAVPAVFSWLLIPPIAITLVEYLYGRNLVHGSTRLFPSMLAGIAVNLVLVIGSIILGVDARDLLHVVALTGISAAAIPAAVTLFIKKPYDPLTPVASWREQMQLHRQAFVRTGTLMEVPL